MSVLTACGVDHEEQIIGSWQSVSGGEKQNRYLTFTDDQTVSLVHKVPDSESQEDYQIRDTDEGFDLEIDVSGEESSFILKLLDPSEGDFNGVFEAYFEDEDTIVIGSERDDNTDSLIRIDRIDEAHGEWMRDKQ
ncbi:hypothetical protein ACTHQ4_15125 [Alkalicoccobacillus gibsonii]|uniref:hypothetical protein n=1 Tax=Alkalicoccobacillus gibsonii TaxID=79881 RepID=UPI003F7C9547